MYKAVLFDLDGTLTDSGLGITNAVCYALEQMNWPMPQGSLFAFVGPPLTDSFQRFCGMTAQQSEEAVRQFRQYYNVTGVFENQVYDGVVEMLGRLKQAGLRLVLATSKPEATAIRVMKHFGLDIYVPDMVGGMDDESRNTKGKVIAHALATFGIDPKDAIMMGDREHDVLGAAENGIPCLGITYGYGDRTELESAGALAVLDTPAEAADFILGSRKLEKIPSFTVNHLTLMPGVYVSRKDRLGAETITTFDLRITAPNREPVLNTAEIHAMEHLGATFLRNDRQWKERVIYFGPMGCRTGFYLVVAGDLESGDVLELLGRCFRFVAEYEGEIPGASARDCGNYLDLNLPMAKFWAKRYADALENLPAECMVYPE